MSPINPPAPDPLNNPAIKDNPAQSFTVAYDSRLADIKEGAWIESYRPAECSNTEFFFETCPTYAIINGVIQVDCVDAEILTQYDINYFDTYLINRAIPQNDNVLNVPHPYEHYAPSDFFGAHCASIGRPNVINPYEKEIWQSDTVSFSDSINLDNGFINGLSTFREKNQKNYELPVGDIISLHTERQLIFVLCQYDWFLASVDDNRVYVQGNGMLTTAGNGFLGIPNQKTKDKYGCQYENTRSIKYLDEGIAWWIDSREASPIICNYSVAETINQGAESYFYNKIKYIQQYNELNTDKFIIHSEFDPLQKKILTTFVKVKQGRQELGAFVNNEYFTSKELNETIIYDIINKVYRGFTAYTPEAFGKLSNLSSGKQLISFASGISYYHNSTDVITYLNFYGVQTDKFVGVASNASPSDVKRFMNICVECNEIAWRAELIESERKQTSYIPIEIFKKREGNWYSNFLMADNSPFPNGLLAIADGDYLVGMWLKVLLKGNPLYSNEYCELKGITIFSFPSNRTNK